MRKIITILVHAAGLCLLFASGCSSGDEPSVGGRVGHPAQPTPSAIQSAAALPLPDTFTLLDQVIADECVFRKGGGTPPDSWPQDKPWGDYLPRAWSQDVPDRDCTKDSECGDGFCDRGRCAAIWTCHDRYGQHCIDDRVFQGSYPYPIRCNGVCLEGRCRSCVSDDECVAALGPPPPTPPASGISCTKANPRAPHHQRKCERWALAPDINRTIP